MLSSKFTLSIFKKNTGRTLKRNERLTCFLPAAAAMAKISIGVSGVLNCERFMIVDGSSFRWVCKGSEKESMMAMSSVDENSAPLSRRYFLKRSRPPWNAATNSSDKRNNLAVEPVALTYHADPQRRSSTPPCVPLCRAQGIAQSLHNDDAARRNRPRRCNSRQSLSCQLAAECEALAGRCC